MPDRLSRLLYRCERLLTVDPPRAVRLARRVVARYPHEPDSALLLAEALIEAGQIEQARGVLAELASRHPGNADAHYLMAETCLSLGDQRTAVAHYLEVHQLDRQGDAETGVDWGAAMDLIARTAESTLLDLPEPFRSRLAGVPIFIEDRPEIELVEQGLDPRAFGLFDGWEDAALQGHEVCAVPSRIVLYRANLVAEFGVGKELVSEVETTLLHEIGHFFGLDEEQLAALGLD